MAMSLAAWHNGLCQFVSITHAEALNLLHICTLLLLAAKNSVSFGSLKP